MIYKLDLSLNCFKLRVKWAPQTWNESEHFILDMNLDYFELGINMSCFYYIWNWALQTWYMYESRLLQTWYESWLFKLDMNLGSFKLAIGPGSYKLDMNLACFKLDMNLGCFKLGMNMGCFNLVWIWARNGALQTWYQAVCLYLNSVVHLAELYFNCLLTSSQWLLVFCVTSSRCRGLVCNVWLWHFLVTSLNFWHKYEFFKLNMNLGSYNMI